MFFFLCWSFETIDLYHNYWCKCNLSNFFSIQYEYIERNRSIECILKCVIQINWLAIMKQHILVQYNLKSCQTEISYNATTSNYKVKTIESIQYAVCCRVHLILVVWFLKMDIFFLSVFFFFNYGKANWDKIL